MILVDSIQTYNTGTRHTKFSHMISTASEDELHAMAVGKLGLRRDWFQRAPFDHYDVTPSKRWLALRYGAKMAPARAILFMNYDYPRRRSVRPCGQCCATMVDSGVDTTRGTFIPGCVKCDLSIYEAKIREMNPQTSLDLEVKP